MKTALFWVTSQRVMAISYRRFETMYLSRLQWLRIHEMLRLGLRMQLMIT